MRAKTTRNLTCIAVLAIVVVAIGVRMYLLDVRGGTQPDQIAWAVNNYAGGITEAYVSMRDTILAWHTEQQPWVYLPGYPLFLAGLFSAGIENFVDVRFAQSVIDAMSILPLYYVLIRTGAPTYPALLSCLVYAAAPWWAAGSTYLLAESLLPALVISLLAMMLWARDRQPSAATWLFIGMISTILPFFRSEMILIIIPLAIWVLLISPKGGRLIPALSVSAGFVLPMLLWAIRNYYVHGQFILLPSVKWYAAWSGLGQVNNAFGYKADDDHAISILASKGIAYHSAEAERYWFNEYLSAWENHPMHVIETIIYRFNQTIARFDAQDIYTSPILVNWYGAMAILTPFLLFLLVKARRISNAFIIALPMIYALGSLGFLYVERRYVRYAGITYLLAFPVLFSNATKGFLQPAWNRLWAVRPS